ncbi:MAG: MMPL family transporter, partial [Burkholderiales bacterium]
MNLQVAAQPSRLGRLGGWAADHRRPIIIAWFAVVLALGSLAPIADRALSGAGWEAAGSESVAARQAIQHDFPGHGSYALSVIVAGRRTGAIVERVSGLLRSDAAVSGVAVAGDHETVVVTGLAGGTPREMVAAAGRLEPKLERLSADGVAVRLTGPAAMWHDFNAANKAAMLRSEELSWPITLVLLLLAFGTLVAAGLPLLLTMAGLLGAGGLLFAVGQVADVSIWAMNFALMFAIALGIDYALFIVVRFRSALASGLEPREATVVTMATAGKAVLVSGLTVLAALLALTLVPVPAFRTVPVGIGLAVTLVLAATLTLLPAVLARLGHRINGGRLRMRGA